MLKNVSENELWVKSYCRASSRVTDVIYALGQSNVKVQALCDQDVPVGPGAIFFDSHAPIPTIIECIAEHAHLCEHQIIAIALDALPHGLSWKLLNAGASDVLAWGSVERPTEIISARLQYWESTKRQLQYLNSKLIGKSNLWQATLRQIVEMASTDCPVLILGESGTGKELVTKEIHQLDARKDKQDLVVVDCTTIVPSLSGSELFGHEKGAFTNAISTRDGAIALANSGTLFLDELGELPLALQPELLRVLQEGTYKRVGSNTWRKAHFRLISATNRDLSEEVKNGNFRQDLFYRISGWVCQLPSLEKRREDIPMLADYFLRKIHKKNQPVDPEVYQYLSTRNYPGNIRELQQLVSRIANKHIGEGPFTVGDIPEADRPNFPEQESCFGTKELEQAVKKMIYAGLSLKDVKDIVTNIAKEVVIDDEHGNLKQAAQKLGCSERILQMHKKTDYYHNSYLKVCH
ncbi:sigma 54-interacting transcriptional regulator [Rufibacter aurantiacus]|uniref:sigma 54-interacting transcriptional regulator n=1 Tax=Rufibacter aurantiacus TaxID=2817374 RepID=UPI001B311E31|nr:sigma 54-interacting transcriptional regulator [Rufibacter aurantiacus]